MFNYLRCLQSKPNLVDPLDFEQFLIKHRTVLQNDPQRELLLYPNDDISVSIGTGKVRGR